MPARRPPPLLVAAALLALCGPAHAAASDPLEVWRGDPLEARVRALRDECGLLPVRGGGWTARDMDELRAGALALPAAARRPPGGPVELELHPDPMPGGMGDGSRAHPEWTGGLRRFHLYVVAPRADARAEFRLQKLDAAQKATLWRRRAAVHALVRRWDDEKGWSRNHGFRAATAWTGPFGRPLAPFGKALNRYEWAYSRARGMESAALDLATFAEEALVPPESLVADAMPADDAVRCQEFSKSRFLASALAEIDPGAPTLARGACPAFEKWADPASLSHFEVLFASPSARHPQSVFGHVMLRPVRKPGVLVRGPSAEPVLEIAALTGAGEPGLRYLFKGMTGGFYLVFSLTSMAAEIHENNELDQRNLRRFRLRLTEAEQLRMLERVWELERRGYVEYWFFTENCATWLAFLVDSVLDGDRRVASPGRLWVMPTTMLDVVADVQAEERRPDGTVVREPLLERLPDDVESSRERAARAERTRDDAVRSLEKLAPQTSRDWRKALRALRDSDPEKRAAALPRLAPLAARSVEQGGAAARAPVYDFAAATLDIERYAADRLEAGRVRAEYAAVQFPPGTKLPSTDDLVLERQTLFQREDQASRAREAMDRFVREQTLLRTAPRRPPTQAERAILEQAAVVRATFRKAAETLGDLLDGPLAGLDPAQRAAELRAARTRENEDALRRSLGPSGDGRWGLGLGAGAQPARADGTASAAAMPLLRLRSSALSELLGEQRQRGYGSSTELRLLDTEAFWELHAGWPRIAWADVAILGFRTALREPRTFRSGPLDLVGWEAGLDWALRPERALPNRLQLHAGLLPILHASPKLERHTILGLSVVGETAFAWAPGTLAAGLRAELLHRTWLGGQYANALRLRGRWETLYSALGAGRGGLLHRAEAVLGIDVQPSARRAFLVSPVAAVRWEREQGDARLSARAGIEIEFP